MIRYTSQNQLTLEGFSHPFDENLDPDNRWVKLAKVIPWDDLASIYSKNLRTDKGRLSVDIRMVLGAMIVKHKLNLSDRETVSTISENIYLQYFCGMKSFSIKRPFDPSLFFDIRKRMGQDVFDKFTDLVIQSVDEKRPLRKRLMSDNNKDNKDESGGSTSKTNNSEKEEKQLPTNKGQLKIDASVADQRIKYPTDLSLLSDSREEAERIIDILYKKGLDNGFESLKSKPRDYRRVAKKQYLNISKKKHKTKKVIRKGIRQQLQYLNRDIKIINQLLDLFGDNFPLKHRDQRIFWVIQHIYDQQKWMYDNKKKSIPCRIVNIYQPWVRPIVRGKEKSNVEFGSKINISEIDGFTKLNRLSWDAYNESEDVETQVEDYFNTFGRYPELLLADQIYLTRKNRTYLKEKGIRIVGKPLGRPSSNILSDYQKRKQRKEKNLRNHVEGKFGQGKNAYGLNQIRAKRMDTSESWIAAIFFVMNLIRLEKLIKVYFWLKSKIYDIVYNIRGSKSDFIIDFNRIFFKELSFLRGC